MVVWHLGPVGFSAQQVGFRGKRPLADHTFLDAPKFEVKP